MKKHRGRNNVDETKGKNTLKTKHRRINKMAET